MAAAAAEPKKKFPGFKNALQNFGQKIDQKIDHIVQKHQERRTGALPASPRPGAAGALPASPWPSAPPAAKGAATQEHLADFLGDDTADASGAADVGTPMLVETSRFTPPGLGGQTPCAPSSGAGPPPGLGGGASYQQGLEEDNARLVYDNAVLRKRAENAHLQTENALLRKKLMEAHTAAAAATFPQPPVNPYYSDSPLPSWGSGYSMEATGWGGYHVDSPMPSWGSNTGMDASGAHPMFADSIPENDLKEEDPLRGLPDAVGESSAPPVVPASLLVLPAVQPQAQPLVVEVGADGGRTCVRWTVDSKRLKGTDKTIVSPSFEFPSCSSAAFKMLIAPKTVSDTKGGASFKRSKGRGRLQIKCASEFEEAGSLHPVTLHAFVGGGAGEEVAHGPVTHNFSESSVCSLEEDWDFAAAVDDAQQSFVVRLELTPASDEC